MISTHVLGTKFSVWVNYYPTNIYWAPFRHQAYTEHRGDGSKQGPPTAGDTTWWGEAMQEEHWTVLRPSWVYPCSKWL